MTGRAVFDAIKLWLRLPGAIVLAHSLEKAPRLNAKIEKVIRKYPMADVVGVGFGPPLGCKALRPANLHVLMDVSDYRRLLPTAPILMTLAAGYPHRP